MSDFVTNIKLYKNHGYAISNINAYILPSKFQYTKYEGSVVIFIIIKVNNDSVEA